MYRSVFINYRGEDSHSYGALLYTELVRRFGEDLVFLDCESIPAGADFVEELLARVRTSRVLLAVIGSRWLTAADATGGRRIDNPGDWIRRELAEAFAAGVRVIPVLTEQSDIPAEVDLPTEIAALSRCQYRRLRHHDPVADLTRIITDLTGLDPTLAAAASSRIGVPRQLPAAPRLFTGRDTELASLTEMVSATRDTGTTVVISASGGMGKTALALHWAYQHLHWFPDGQLYINLHGFDPSGQPTPPGAALRGFLAALGVDLSELPIELDAQAARYRSLVAGKRILIVLDNASDIDQLTSLLPGSTLCTVLVTSRRHFAGLVATHDAHLLPLSAIPELDARALLARHLAPDRLAAEPDAVADLLATCAGMPLAVRIIGARAALHPTFPLAVLADDLRKVSTRLDGLDAGDLRANLRAVLSWSFHTLSSRAARLFGLMGIAPGPDISLAAAAVLAAFSTRQAGVVLRELENSSLIQQHVPGRYRMHDLIRLYARDTAHYPSDEFPEAAECDVFDREDLTASTGRLLKYHLDAARAADYQLQAMPGQSVPHRFADRDSALVWFDAERANLTAAAVMAADTGRAALAVDLAGHLSMMMDWRRYFSDWVDVAQVAVQAADQIDDQRRRGISRTHLGLALTASRRFDEAVTAHTMAADIFREIGDRHGEGNVLDNLGDPLQQLRRFDEAVTAHTMAAAIFRETGDRNGEGMALDNLGRALAGLGRLEEAVAVHTAAIDIFRETGDRHGEGMAHTNFGATLQQFRRFDEAVTAHTMAAAIFRETGDCNGEGQALTNIASALASIGRPEEAVTAQTNAAAIFRETGDRHGEGMAQHNLGLILQQLRRFDEAVTGHTTAADIFRETGDGHGEIRAQANLGLALGHLRRPEEALQAWEQTVLAMHDSGDNQGAQNLRDLLDHVHNLAWPPRIEDPSRSATSE